jgi:hypothetical protein
MFAPVPPIDEAAHMSTLLDTQEPQ